MSERPSDIHVPVMRSRCLELLAPALSGPRGVLLDATLGMAGHAEAALDMFPDLTLVGLDRDPEALSIAGRRLERFGERLHLVHAVYDQLGDVCDDLGIDRIDGVLFDLGVSSLQLDSNDRGFAYSRDMELDMRMDQSTGIGAAEVLATYSESELRTVLKAGGEEAFAGRIASRVVARRQDSPLRHTKELDQLIHEAIPAAARRTGGNPSKRTFQALRIEVNDELRTLARAIPLAIERLAIGGRIVVMSYHSGEDKLVKRQLKRGSTSSAPPDMPIELEETKPYLKLLTRGAERPDEGEIEENPRSAPARLRAAEKVRSYRPERSAA